MRIREEKLSEAVALLAAHAGSRGIDVEVTMKPDGTQEDYIDRIVILSRALLYGWERVTLP